MGARVRLTGGAVHEGRVDGVRACGCKWVVFRAQAEAKGESFVQG